MKKSKIILLIFLISLFIANTIFVYNGYSAKLDASVHNFIFSFNSDIMTKIMNIFTFFGSTLFIIALSIIIFIILFVKSKTRESFCVTAMIVISTVVNNVIKLLICRERPEYMMVVEKTYSYPSGHTMASFTLYGFLIYLLIKSKSKKIYKILFSILLSIIIIFVPISRIYLGAHYFTDIIGAILASSILILLFDIVDDKKQYLKKD